MCVNATQVCAWSGRLTPAIRAINDLLKQCLGGQAKRRRNPQL